jgi:predicted DNA-binding transcriptional regulator AlpA
MDQEWVTGPQLQRRFGISGMSLWRWMNDPMLDFPRPGHIRGRNYWRLSDIINWERRTAADVLHSGKGRPPD